MTLALVIDTKALLDSALVGAAATFGLVATFCVALLAFDQISVARSTDRSVPSLVGVWIVAIGAGLVAVAIVVIGLWAMTQK